MYTLLSWVEYMSVYSTLSIEWILTHSTQLNWVERNAWVWVLVLLWMFWHQQGLSVTYRDLKVEGNFQSIKAKGSWHILGKMQSMQFWHIGPSLNLDFLGREGLAEFLWSRECYFTGIHQAHLITSFKHKVWIVTKCKRNSSCVVTIHYKGFAAPRPLPQKTVHPDFA